MPVGLVQFAITTNAWGGATVNSSRALMGEVLSVRMANAGTAITNGAGVGGTTDFTITRALDGGTIASLSNVTAPFQYQPRDPTHSITGGTSAYTLGTGPVYVTEGVPMWGTVSVVVADGQFSKSGTLFMHYRR